jgi:hypothetical protein
MGRRNTREAIGRNLVVEKVAPNTVLAIIRRHEKMAA